jgi:hypothetical protein
LLNSTTVTPIFSRAQVSSSLRLMPQAPSPTQAKAGQSGRASLAPPATGNA